MRKSLRLLFLLLMGLAFTAQAQNNPNQPIPTDPNVKIGKLPNGLTYYIQRNSKPEKKVELRLVLNAGSILERDDQQGYAHFMEHMAFNGSKNFKKNELVSYLQSIGVEFGADLNAYTSFDETVYILPIPDEKPELLDKGLLVLKDWASGLTLDKEEVKKEQGVVLEELRLGKGADDRMREKYFPKLLYGSQYANRLPIGKKELLENVNYKALVDFYEDWYRPDLMAVMAVGDFDAAQMEAKIKATFSDIKAKRKAKPRVTFPVPDHKETFVSIESDKEATGTSVEFYFKKPETKVLTQMDFRKSLVMAFYNGMLGARFDELRQSPKAPFRFAGSGFGGFIRGKSAFSMFGSTVPDKINETIIALLNENKRVKDFGFTPAELERQKARYLASLENSYKERDKTQSFFLIDRLVNSFLSQTPVPAIDFTYQFGKNVVPTITLEEVNALAKNTTSEDNRVIIITGLADGKAKYPTEQEVLNLIKEADSAKLTPYTETVATEPLVANLPTTPKVMSESKDDKFGLTYWTLSNGVKVVLKPTDFKADEITMRGFSPGGFSLIDDEKYKTGSGVNQLIGESGVKNLSRIDLGKMLSGKRIAASVSVGELFETVSGAASPKDFETMLQLAYLKFTNVNFDKNVFDSNIAKQKMSLPMLASSPDFYFLQERLKIENKDNPRFVNPFDLESIEKFNFENMKAIYQDRFADASDFTFIFVGNFEPEKVKPLITQYLGNLPSINRKETWKDLNIKSLEGKYEKVINKGIEDKSQVSITFRGDAEFNLNENRHLSALGELLSIKLVEILREEKGGVYGVGASGGMSKIPKGRFFFSIEFPCGSKNVDSLIKAALDEVVKIQNGQIDDKDIAKVKEARLLKAKENYKENSYWSSLLYGNLAEGNDLIDLAETENRINSINKEEMQKVAKKYLNLDKKIQFVLMPEDKK